MNLFDLLNKQGGDTPSAQATQSVSNRDLMDKLNQMHRDMVRVETRLCKLADVLGHGYIMTKGKQR